MKLFKTVLAASAVAALMSSCTDVADATDEQLAGEGIEVKTASIYNAYGTLPSGLDVVNSTLIKGVVVGEVSKKDSTATNKSVLKWGAIAYKDADSTLVDFKTVNSENRASTLTGGLKSLNGTTYAAIDSATFAEVTKNYKKFKEKLLSVADTATAKTLTYATDKPYFVTKLGNARGYALVKVAAFSATDTSPSTTNTGKVTIDYYYVSKENATK